MAAIYHCFFFKKDENKTNAVSNYIGNKLTHITLYKHIWIITKWENKLIYKQLIYKTSLTPPPFKVSIVSAVCICLWGGSILLLFLRFLLLGKLTSSLYIDKLTSSLYMYIDKFISHFWVGFHKFLWLVMNYIYCVTILVKVASSKCGWNCTDFF